jgi:hypothetical protein
MSFQLGPVARYIKALIARFPSIDDIGAGGALGPRTIPDLFAWYEASKTDIADMIVNEESLNTYVTTIRDQTGAGHDAVSPVDHHPLVFPPGAGHPMAVGFGEPAWAILPSELSTLEDITVAAMFRVTVPDSINTIVEAGNHDNSAYAFSVFGTKGQLEWRQGSYNLNHVLVSDLLLSPQAFHFGIARRRRISDVNDRVAVWADDSQKYESLVARGGDANGPAVLCNSLGGGGNGVILAEALFYLRALTDFEVEKLRWYFQQKYAAALAIGVLGTNHLHTPDVRNLVEAIHSIIIPSLGFWDSRDHTGGLSWDASDVNLHLNTGDSVAVWPERSISPGGGGYPWEQPNVYKQPTFDLRGLNGKPAIHFDGTTQLESITTQIFPGRDGSSAIFIVFGRETANAVTLLACDIPNTDEHVLVRMALKDTSGAAYVATAEGPYESEELDSGTSIGVDGKAHIFTYVKKFGANRTADIRIDGASMFFDGNPPSFDPSFSAGQLTWLGSDPSTSETFTGWIAEVIIFARYLEPAEVQQIEKYLALKWS